MQAFKKLDMETGHYIASHGILSREIQGGKAKSRPLDFLINSLEYHFSSPLVI